MQVFFSTKRIQSIDTLAPDGRGGYSRKTQAELEATEGPLEIVSEDEAYSRERAKHIKPAKEVDEARYYDMLECLPPCKWHGIGGGISVFHVSERISCDIVSWFYQAGDRYFELQDSSMLTDAQLLARIAPFITQGATT